MAQKNNGPKAGKYGTVGGVVVALALAGASQLGLFGGDDNAGGGQGGDSQSGQSSNAAQQTPGADSAAGSECAVDTLPEEARDQIEDIITGSPSDDGPHDGKHFGNYEGLLPKEKSSYYREYTVKTTGLNHRGERRLVVGGGTETDPEVWYYTSDHFESFCEIPDAED